MHRLPIAALLVAAAACADASDRGADERAAAGAPGAGVTPTPAPDTRASSSPGRSDTAVAGPGIIFDAATIREGDTVAGFRVARVDITDAGPDFGRVGTVRFIGEATISGETSTHPDYPDVTTLCMDLDPASAARLPRWPADSRTRSWLCFENQEEAIRRIGPAGPRKPIAVVIDAYQTPRQFSDVYNTARLVRVVQPSP